MPRTNVRSVMVELHRFGTFDALQVPGSYILTTGDDSDAREVKFKLSAREFQKNLRDLRYSKRTVRNSAKAIDILSKEASLVVEDVSVAPGDIVQIDLVAGANELWAFPFEACLRDGKPLFANRDHRVVLTRRLRGKFSDQTFVWPAQPSVLFAHAATGADLGTELVDAHADALKEALDPWTGGKKIDDKLLVVAEITSVQALTNLLAARRAEKKPDFTHVHLLAHGLLYEDDEVGERAWGMRLGPEGSPALKPRELAQVLKPSGGLPVAVTIASCDSGNETDSGLGNYSLSQELHRSGVPVVVGSQFPLTQEGSKLLAKHFYAPLMCGKDVRVALHEARAALYENRKTAYHDWVSVVGYVRLPEGYADRLIETALRSELAMLKAVQSEIDALILAPDENRIAGAEARLNERIASLRQLLEEVPAREIALRQEGEGLLASAYKRLGEMYHRCGRPEKVREQLQSALEHYRNGFKLDIHNHWLGAQQLALEAVLEGRFSNLAHWPAVILGAQFEVETKPNDSWPLGTLAELEFLRHLTGQPADPDAVSRALAQLRARAGADPFPIESTRRQFNRYVDWWTCANGFFPNCTDLSEQAKAAIAQIDAFALASNEPDGGIPQLESPANQDRAAVPGDADKGAAYSILDDEVKVLGIDSDSDKDLAPPENRYLEARFPRQVRLGTSPSLEARIAAKAPLKDAFSSPLGSREIPDKGLIVKLSIHCSGGFRVTPSVREVTVKRGIDSDWVEFPVEALQPGVHRLEIIAYVDGGQIGALNIESTIHELAATSEPQQTARDLTIQRRPPGDATLEIHYDSRENAYRYKWIAFDRWFGPEEITHRLETMPTNRIDRLLSRINAIARERLSLGRDEAGRLLKGEAIQLWSEIIPKQLEEEFASQRTQTKRLMLRTHNDAIPWELLHPPDGDAGFLAEQFILSRWSSRRQLRQVIDMKRGATVVPPGSPPRAMDEVSQIAGILTPQTELGKPIENLIGLIRHLDDADFQLLHFACHHSYSLASGIDFDGAYFTPAFLNLNLEKFSGPLVFINACRSDDKDVTLTGVSSWADKFIECGAAAFVGTLWDVRDEPASRFAQAFYKLIAGGATLGDAVLRARTEIRDSSDPTWLAYTLYADPGAVVRRGI